jgi:hypothetical protein
VRRPSRVATVRIAQVRTYPDPPPCATLIDALARERLEREGYVVVRIHVESDREATADVRSDGDPMRLRLRVVKGKVRVTSIGSRPSPMPIPREEP